MFEIKVVMEQNKSKTGIMSCGQLKKIKYWEMRLFCETIITTEFMLQTTIKVEYQ